MSTETVSQVDALINVFTTDKVLIKKLFKTTNVKIEYEKDNKLSVIAKTPRLIIRPVEIDDIEFYQNELWGSHDVMKYFGSGNLRLYWNKSKSKEIDYAKERISIWINRWNKSNPFSGYTVETKYNQQKIGHIIIGGGELAFLFSKKSWGNGYGTESIIVLTNIILPTLIKNNFASTNNINKIIATVRIENIASQRVMEKAGFKTDKKLYFKRFDDSLYKRYYYEASVESLVEILARKVCVRIALHENELVKYFFVLANRVAKASGSHLSI